MLDRFFSRGRARAAARRLAGSPTAANYAALAQIHAASGQLKEVIKVCEEGLRLFPDDCSLERLKDRATTITRDDRVRDLQREIKRSPRPALWKELCSELLSAGHLTRAEKIAEQWYLCLQDIEALYYRASIRTERYFVDRRRDDARIALDFLSSCTGEGADTERVLRLSLSIYSKCGAWSEARTALARLLELSPGDPALEARFRTVAAMAEGGKSLDQALREVERTGKFVDDDVEFAQADSSTSIRPLLSELASQDGVNGAFYVRGGTALVQGPRGASAERYARGVRELVTSTRSFARRLGLGRPLEISLEGDFGSLSIRPGTLGAAAVWRAGPPSPHGDRALAELVGHDSRSTGGAG